MFTLNPIPSSPVAFSKSTHQHYPIKRIQIPHNFTHSPFFLNKSTPLSSELCNFNKIHGFPLGKIQALTAKTSHLENILENPYRKPGSHVPKAAASSEPNPGAESVEAAEAKSKAKTLQLALVFGFWYFQNIVFNIYNKKALNVFSFPWLLASFQLFAGSVWMLVLWSLKLQPCPKITKPFIIALLGPALFHTIGHISACVSFSKVAVSFTHVIKSSEPVFSVVFSSFLGDTYPLKVWLSILPIVLGCSLAAVTEVSFNPQGLWGALISNVGFVLRNIYSKKSLQNFKEVNGLNLYGCISIISLFYLFPVAVVVEGSQWVQGYHNAIQTVGKASTFYLWVLLSGIFYHLYNQSSYEALDEISPLTFSVGNTMKRVVVIVSTVLVFRNPVRPLNALGSGIAILGTFLYSQATAKKKSSDGEKKS
ncbi:Xylulose 5-phosphate/phosphate translocator [Hibiscus syriacus]|uniref:Xylulose 5-phosphate/phosphate translocator n=1 Tax=Hibiscus syriacus TaxID=106335 RepID=A0A6A3BBD1_HIBSY|nr:xylulose 5-phosphate/phosphate translocator, chloroplastic-like [Hibiscus syriacus]KAE8713307.1 Xylulose 5-phosphate/phosphate translocator [Hibiscus syriacus]